MENLHLAALEEVRRERTEYLAELTDEERTAFLAQLLAELNDPSPLPNLHEMAPTVATLSDKNLTYYPPDEQSGVINNRPCVVQAAIWQNGNWRARCGCDQVGNCSTLNHGRSYMAVNYNRGRGRGMFDIRVYLRRYGREHFHGRGWDYFENCHAAYKLWRSGLLTGPDNPGRQGHFFNGNNQTPGLRTGTLGIAAYTPGTTTRVWWGLWYFDSQSFVWWENLGDEWLRCGKDYGIWIEDTN